MARQRDIQYVSSALSQCFTCLGGAQLTVVVGALRNAALLQLRGRFHSSSSKVTAAAKNSLQAKAAAAQPPKHLQHGLASRSSLLRLPAATVPLVEEIQHRRPSNQTCQTHKCSQDLFNLAARPFSKG